MWRLHRLRKQWLSWRLTHQAPADYCFYCGVLFEKTGSRQRSLDHIIPKSCGGKNRVNNLVFACQKCNQKKGSRTAEEFLASSWLEQRCATIEKEQTKPQIPNV